MNFLNELDQFDRQLDGSLKQVRSIKVIISSFKLYIYFWNDSMRLICENVGYLIMIIMVA